ncbi:MAG: type II toxin-antitoxin system Phd/YefM family antitoxin [Deltaproteobacteria bacterium]|nr:type II toxin-antitoxin system Phd/YefM family antitoxin [Deltaproteobacteria bacterium]
MGKVWQLQEAKNRLSEVVAEARTSGPQLITRRGAEAAVVLSIEEYRRLVQPKQGLAEFLRSSPLAQVELELDRSQELSREVEL